MLDNKFDVNLFFLRSIDIGDISEMFEAIFLHNYKRSKIFMRKNKHEHLTRQTFFRIDDHIQWQQVDDVLNSSILRNKLNKLQHRFERLFDRDLLFQHVHLQGHSNESFFVYLTKKLLEDGQEDLETMSMNYDVDELSELDHHEIDQDQLDLEYLTSSIHLEDFSSIVFHSQYLFDLLIGE